MFSFMNLLQMSFYGAVTIFIIVIFRVLFMNRLPKKVFVALWMIALFRLLIPISLASPFSIYSLAQKNEDVKSMMDALKVMPAIEAVPVEESMPLDYAGGQESREYKEKIKAGYKAGYHEGYDTTEDMEDEAENGDSKHADEEYANGEYTGSGYMDKIYPEQNNYDYKLNHKLNSMVWMAVYITGVIILAAFFISSYVKCRKEFNISLPARHEAAYKWMKEHPFKRKISIRQTGFTCTPLTYGIISPVILMPKITDWEDKEQLEYILAHELTHIKRFDAVTKLIMAGTLCIHWFNPFVWVMYNLLNRDLELSCDEEVIREFGEKAKASYARTLIKMEERKSGLIPLWNSFSKSPIGKNAMEERITAIMKSRKTSVTAVFAEIILVLMTVVIFTTSASAVSGKYQLKRLPFGDLTDDESEKLLALWFDEYESMTVTDFRRKAAELTDTEKYMELIEDFSQAGYTVRMKEGKEADALDEYMDYFYHVYEPLTAERWQVREFSGSVEKSLEPEIRGQVSWEYVISLKILKPDELKVREYQSARVFAEEDMRTFLQDRTEAELSDGEYLLKAARERVNQIERERSSDKLEVSVAYALFPLEVSPDDAIDAQTKEQWDKTLAPYLEFGLTWQYHPSPDNPENGLRMYWKGTEVRGIMDEERGMWITEHTGNSMYSENAVELYVVYEKGKAVGLRPANNEEEAEWDAIRKNNALSAGEEYEEEKRRKERTFPNGSRQDYDSLYELTSPNYKEMSVAEFNDAVLAWCNEDYERMERVGTDSALKDYAVDLTEEERHFAAFTLWFSRMENYRVIQSIQTGKREQDPEYEGEHMNRQSEDGLAWCTLDYRFTYHIADKDKLKVAERDECLEGMISGIRRFWEETDLETLLLMSEEDIVDRFRILAKKYGSDLLTIEVNEDMVVYQCKDER
ncbi:M56 family metallopeptidase [Parablautia intestinalis]|uniref:M56 family metallopeptidase n=1 Tax=Parablautia intestinalis TaxID=2320100 RepID=UPI00259CC06B|nr:M56 family metallopeptidase [Parablautia intestinalis]